jgi:subtilisin family serine protease
MLRAAFTAQNQGPAPSGGDGGQSPLDAVKLAALMELSAGRPEISIGLIDGPLLADHPDLTIGHVHEVHGKLGSACIRKDSAACQHGTFVAGILSAKRGSLAPAICPDCTLLVRPVFTETEPGDLEQASAEPAELTAAILACIEAGARMLNLSLALMQPSTQAKRTLLEALDYAARRGVVIVAAAGNEGTVGSTVITGHPWVIPVAACSLSGKPLNESNLGHSIGRHGLRAPGEKIMSLGAEGKLLTLGGTSAATPFVTGAIALVWSQFPSLSAAQIRLAFVHAHARARTNVTPPLLNAWAAYQLLLASHSKR